MHCYEPLDKGKDLLLVKNLQVIIMIIIIDI